MSEHDGHRLRLIEKLNSGALQEHEILEALLFNAIPRRNTNDLAHRLLSQFGSIKSMFSATLDELCAVKGIGLQTAAYLKCIGVFYERYYAPTEFTYEGKYDSEQFVAFVKEKYKDLYNEVLDVYYLDKNSVVYDKKRFTTDSLFNVSLEPQAFTKAIVEDQPAGVILVHNHPFGDAKTSSLDDKMTVQCQIICSMHNILLCEHIIYSAQGVYSYYLSGKLKKISKEFSADRVLESAAWKLDLEKPVKGNEGAGQV
ncbi:MAG: RadC family protein [Clostridia bacterium]|nr:RadC family protein [Clostridia bacterium]